jgi:hypothetical protein
VAKSLHRSAVGWFFASFFSIGIAPVILLFLQPTVASSSAVRPVPAAVEAVPTPEERSAAAVKVRVAALEKQFTNGVRCFYWIAVLSLANTFLVHFANWSFYLGLGVTRVVDALAFKSERGGLVIAPLLSSFCISGVFALFGFFGLKRKSVPIIIGLGLFVLDSFIFVAEERWLSVAFHALFSCAILVGYLALQEMNKMLEQKPQA